MPSDAQRLPFHIDVPNTLDAALAALRLKGGQCYLVGGCVRDAILGDSPTDFDIEVYGLDLDAIARSLSELGKTDLVGKSFAVVKFWSQGEEYDFTVPRLESKLGHGHRGFDIQIDPRLDAKTALGRRDFTINALLYDTLQGDVIDYFGGLEDLRSGRLRHVSEAFSEDPLRALRAMQFAGRFGFTLDSETAKLCRDMKREFASLPSERIWIEWRKWATQSKSPSKGLKALEDSGWIVFFPELNALLRLPQDSEWHPEGDVFTHTLHCLDALRDNDDWPGFDTDARATLTFATLCHDLGKARRTRFSEIRGQLRWNSPGHDQDSGWLSVSLLERIGAPATLAAKVKTLVENHHFLNSLASSSPSDASLRRLAKRIHPATTHELYHVMMADHRGRPPLLSETQERRLGYFKTGIERLDLEESAPKPILLGRHLIDAGLKPGPGFKNILDTAYEAQLDGAFENLDSALEWARRKSLL